MACGGSPAPAVPTLADARGFVGGSRMQGGGQVEPSFLGVDVGDVPHPLLIGARRRGCLGQVIGCDGQIMFAVRGDHSIAFLLPAAEPFFAHDPRYSIAPVAGSRAGECLANARAAIGLAAFLMQFNHLGAQELLFASAGTRLILTLNPIVITAARDLQQVAENLDGKFTFQRVDALEPLFGGSERMPNVFFKCRAAGARAPAPAGGKYSLR